MWRSGPLVFGALLLLGACRQEVITPSAAGHEGMDLRSVLVGTYVGQHHHQHTYYGTVDTDITYQDTFLVRSDTANSNVLIVDGFPVLLLSDSSLEQAVDGLVTQGHFTIQNGVPHLSMFVQFSSSPHSDMHHYTAERP